MVLFDTQINETSRLARNTLAPIAYKHNNTLRIHRGFTERTVANLFKNLQKTNMCSLDDLSPYFVITLVSLCKGASKETWEHQKGRKTHPLETIIRNDCPAALLNVLHKDLRIPHVSKAQLRLLSILIRLLIEHLLEPSTSESAAANKETNKSWGHLVKFSLPVMVAFTDGSASKDKTRAGFNDIFPELPDRNMNSQIKDTR
jgi:hypothetical protein